MVTIKPIDILVFVGFVASVIALGLFKSGVGKKKGGDGEQKAGEDYFLAGRGLTWWLVGFSLIAANISTEQFVGMSGKSADWLGMAIASYEWMAAITLVVVAFVFLPTFLKSGIYTIPEFLEYRYNSFARLFMAVSTLVILVGVPTASVIYSGAKVISVFFQGITFLGLDLGSITVGCWIIGCLAAIYVFAGGLKACAWADLIQGAALIVGGGIIAYLALKALGTTDVETLAQTAANPNIDIEALRNSGPIDRLVALNSAPLPAGKLNMVRPASDPEIPWTALVLGLWIPNFFYWGLNQYITQRTLGSKSLAEGQRGVVFAALLKLLIPFVVVIPGILAYNLFSGDLQSQAERRNTTVMEEFRADEQMYFPFNEQFAEVHPDVAAEVLAHNVKLSGVTPDTTGTDPVALAAANGAIIDGLDKEQKTLVNKVSLVGYDYDAAFPTLLRNLLPAGKGIMGFVLAAIFGAVVSSLASMLNSASTIFSMDIYHKARKNAPESELVKVGRFCVLVFVVIAMLIAPRLDNPKFGGIFTFIQEFQGFISSGILAVFIFGVLVHKAPRHVGTIGLVLNPILYGALKYAAPSIPFLNRMAYCFITILIVLGIITLLKPMPEPVVLPVNKKMNMNTDKGTKLFGAFVIALTLVLYIIFW